MATIWDEFMAQRGSPDYTLGSRATLQPTGSPFSPDGRLGNMGMRNMLLAQQRMSTMPGFMPPDYSVPRVAEPRAPFVPQPEPGYEGAAGRRLSGALLAMQPQPGYDMPPDVPLPPRRPSMPMAPAGAPMQLGSAAPSVRESFMQRLLSGPNYQSNSMPALMTPQGPTPSGAAMPQQINWGDPDSAADFVRANQAYMGLLG